MICGTRPVLRSPQWFFGWQYHLPSFHLQLHLYARGQLARPQLWVAAQRFPLRAAWLVHQELIAPLVAANAVLAGSAGRPGRAGNR